MADNPDPKPDRRTLSDRRDLSESEQIDLVVTILQAKKKEKVFKRVSKTVLISLGLAVTAETCRRIYRRVIRK